jgi:hypothetical protein
MLFSFGGKSTDTKTVLHQMVLLRVKSNAEVLVLAPRKGAEVRNA